MKNKKAGIEKRAPTLLELSQNTEKRTPSPTLSSSSDEDQPPVAASQIRIKAKSAINLYRNYDTELSPLPTRRSNSKHCEHLKNLTETLPGKREISFKTLYGTTLRPPSSYSTNSQGLLSRESSSVKIRSSSSVEDRRVDMVELTPSLRTTNYHIKAIRRGVPDILSTNPHGRTKIVVSTDVEITPNCVCTKNPKRRTDLKAWSFSFVTAFLCIICPLISFSSDITFFSICRGHYDQSWQILQDVQRTYGPSTTTAPTTTPVRPHLSNNRGQFDGHHKHTRLGRDVLQQIDVGLPFTPIKRTTRYNAIRSLPLQPEKEMNNPHALLSASTVKTSTSSFSSLPASSHSTDDTMLKTLGKCHFTANTSAPVCANQSELIAYILTSEAKKQLDSHHHLIKDVFEPIFILGSFPSLILCMFSRSVIMVTSHDHFLSAYVMDIMTMPLQLATGALSFSSASYHFGPYGMECWKCALDENCSKAEASFWQKDNVIVSLIIATAAKFLDGMAGGVVLVVVLFRLIWTPSGHVSCWWYAARSILSLLIILFCITAPTTMLLTPSLAVFQSELLENMTFFEEKTSLCYSSLALLSVGACVWSVSLFVLLLYLSYRTYVYCRIKEHLPGSDLL